MRIKSQKDFWAGLMFTAAGVGFGWGATNYTVGEAARMGPGYFPLMLGSVLGLIGLVIVLQALVVETEDGERIGRFAWKPLFFVIAANVLFGIMIGGIPRTDIVLGLIVGIYAVVFVASLAEDEFHAKGVALLATALAVLSYLAFIALLNLQFPVWPSFFIR